MPGKKVKPEPIQILVLFAVILMTIISSLLIIGTQFSTTSSVSAELKAYTLKGELDAELTQSGLSYELNINRSGSGGGGVLPGLGSPAGIKFDNISTDALYLKGFDEFQENVGFLLNSYKNKYYTISADTSGTGDLNKRTKVNISMHVDRVPYWPSGIGQDFGIEVELVQIGAANKIVIESVQVQQWRGLDSDEVHFVQSRVIWSKSPGYELTREGQSRKFVTSVKIETGNALVGLLGYVRISFYDSSGNKLDPNLVSNIAEPDPAEHTIPLGLTINLRVLDRTETIKLGMLLASFPLSIFSLVLTIACAILFGVTMSRPRLARKAAAVLITAGVIQLIACVFLYAGTENLINVLDASFKADLRSGFSWTGTIVFMAAAGILPVVAGSVTLAAFRPKKAENK